MTVQGGDGAAERQHDALDVGVSIEGGQQRQQRRRFAGLLGLLGQQQLARLDDAHAARAALALALGSLVHILEHVMTLHHLGDRHVSKRR